MLLSLERPDWDNYWMAFARVAARRGTCSRLQVGAVVVAGNKIKSSGYNGNASGEEPCEHDPREVRCKTAIHAEKNALHSMDDFGGTIYITHSPCLPCAALIKVAQIERVVFERNYKHPYPVSWLESYGIEVVKLGV